MSEPDPILVERRGPAAVITLNRPHAMNSFSRRLVDRFAETIEELAEDAAVRALIVTGAGPKAFCAGADLKERATMAPAEVRAFLRKLNAQMDRLASLPKPTLAAINGYALGGGLELALACDLRYAATTAKMGLTEVRLAIIPGAGGTQRLPRVVGLARAKELVLTGRRIDAARAAEIGLVNETVDPQALVDRCVEVVEEIALGGPLAIAQAKFAVDHGSEVSLPVGLAVEKKAYELLIPTTDRIEALAAFREKRPPRFEGK